MSLAFRFDEDDFNDPASLPTRDGKPVLPGDEIENCGTCGYCRLRIDDAKKPFASCIFEGDPRYKRYIAQIFPVDPKQTGCAEWKSGQSYAEQLWFWRWKRRCANDPDCQMDRKKELEAEAQDYAEGLKEDKRRGLGPKPPPIIGGHYG